MFGINNRKNPPILIYVKQDPVDQVYKRSITLSSDGTKAEVMMFPEKDKKAGWKLDVTGCIRNSSKGMYVEAFYGSPKAIKIDSDNKAYTFSKLTNDQMQEFVNQKIFKAHYGKLLGDLVSALKPYLLIIVVVAIISIAVGGYNAYTISKMPESIINGLMPTTTPTPPIIIS